MGPLPLRRRPLDIFFVVWFVFNIAFIAYIVDVEQLIIADPFDFEYPLWPPRVCVDVIHWYGTNYDPLQNARPAFWRAMIWLEVLLFGPYYAVATWAFIKGKDWIRLPSLIWGAVIMTNVVIILFEETVGVWASPRLDVVYGVNLPWLVVPLLMIIRMAPLRPPFSRPDPE